MQQQTDTASASSVPTTPSTETCASRPAESTRSPSPCATLKNYSAEALFGVFPDTSSDKRQIAENAGASSARPHDAASAATGITPKSAAIAKSTSRAAHAAGVDKRPSRRIA